MLTRIGAASRLAGNIASSARAQDVMTERILFILFLSAQAFGLDMCSVVLAYERREAFSLY
jgi:hypothetical protein